MFYKPKTNEDNRREALYADEEADRNEAAYRIEQLRTLRFKGYSILEADAIVDQSTPPPAPMPF